MSELKAKGITKKYGTKEVLHGIDLTLEKGKIYGLIGRNGAGKTTLLSILTSQNPATEGSVTFDEMQVWENPEALKHLCFSRELNQLQGGNANAMKVKEYLWARSDPSGSGQDTFERKYTEPFGKSLSRQRP